MATDNDSLLTNRDAERSLFGYTTTLRDSQSLGNVKVVDCQFAMPKDTIKKRYGVAYELKPTTDKLSSSIRSNVRSFAVPMRTVWKYADSFISKGSEFIQNGGTNTPFIQTLEGTSNVNLPTFKIGKLFGYFLAGAGSGSYPNPNRCLKTARKGNASDFTGKYEGNRQSWNYSYYRNGIYSEEPNDSARGAIPLWWTPRIIGDGVKNSRFNHATNSNGSSPYRIRNSIHTSDADIVLSACALGHSYPIGQYDGYGSYVAPHLCITQTYDKASHKVYYFLYWGDGLTLASSTASPVADISTNQWHFAVDTETNDNQRYGRITFNPHVPFLGTRLVGATGVTWGKNQFCPLYMSGSSSDPEIDDHYAKVAFAIACNMLFNNADMLGYGSLCESLGVSLFERVNYYRAWSSTSINRFSGRWHLAPTRGDTSISGGYPSIYHQSLDYSYNQLNENIWKEICDDEFTTTICTLPFYAYQKCITDRFLLKHETLTNNYSFDSSVDYGIKYDSPYFRNNMIPTMCYFHNLSTTNEDEDERYLYVSDTDNPKWCLNSTGDDEDTFTLSNPELWHYSRSINEFCTIFLSRNALLQMDVFTKIWQRENHNIQNLLDAENYGVVDSTGKLQVKKFLLAHAFEKMVRYGGTDQSASKVLERIYGINDVPECTNSVILLSERHKIVKTEDVLNTGGAVDSDGNSLALGEKCSVASDTLEVTNDFNCFCPEFSFLLTLHWFDAENVRASVPNFCTNRLGRFYNTRKAFQIAFFPLFQSLGDDALYIGDMEFGGNMTHVIGWTNKNNLLKDSDVNNIRGEWLGKYRKQLVSATAPWKSQLYAPSLTYGYLQPMSFQYAMPLVDRFGDAVLTSWSFDTYKKSCMTKSNILGL